MTPSEELKTITRILNDLNSLLKADASKTILLSPKYHRIQSNLLELNKKIFGELPTKDN